MFSVALHPAILRDNSEKREIFEKVFLDHGLKSLKLTRNSLVKLTFPQVSNGLKDEVPQATVTCPNGDWTGVAATEQQYGVIHSVSGGTETVRFFTLFASVPKVLQEKASSPLRMGMVHFFTQAWTSLTKSPETLLGDAAKLSALNEPLAAWILAEGARRHLSQNSHFAPTEGSQARKLVDEYQKRIPTSQDVRQVLQPILTGTHWDFAEFTTVFRSGIKPAVRFRFEKPEDVKIKMQRCEDFSQAIGSWKPELKRNFGGVLCLPYGQYESIQRTPVAGGFFVNFK
jgi:hypothetical protein